MESATSDSPDIWSDQGSDNLDTPLIPAPLQLRVDDNDASENGAPDLDEADTFYWGLCMEEMITDVITYVDTMPVEAEISIWAPAWLEETVAEHTATWDDISVTDKDDASSVLSVEESGKDEGCITETSDRGSEGRREHETEEFEKPISVRSDASDDDVQSLQSYRSSLSKDTGSLSRLSSLTGDYSTTTKFHPRDDAETSIWILDKLLVQVSCEAVKEHLRQIYALFQASVGQEPREPNIDTIFIGETKNGVTAIAQLYAELITSLGRYSGWARVESLSRELVGTRSEWERVFEDIESQCQEACVVWITCADNLLNNPFAVHLLFSVAAKRPTKFPLVVSGQCEDLDYLRWRVGFINPAPSICEFPDDTGPYHRDRKLEAILDSRVATDIIEYYGFDDVHSFTKGMLDLSRKKIDIPLVVHLPALSVPRPTTRLRQQEERNLDAMEEEEEEEEEEDCQKLSLHRHQREDGNVVDLGLLFKRLGDLIGVEFHCRILWESLCLDMESVLSCQTRPQRAIDVSESEWIAETLQTLRFNVAENSPQPKLQHRERASVLCRTEVNAAANDSVDDDSVDDEGMMDEVSSDQDGESVGSYDVDRDDVDMMIAKGSWALYQGELDTAVDRIESALADPLISAHLRAYALYLRAKALCAGAGRAVQNNEAQAEAQLDDAMDAADEALSASCFPDDILTKDLQDEKIWGKWLRYRVSLSYIDEAIENSLASLASRMIDQDRKGERLKEAMRLFVIRFEALGRLDDLNAAIDYAEKWMGSVDISRCDEWLYVCRLYHTRSSITASRQDLGAARFFVQQALKEPYVSRGSSRTRAQARHVEILIDQYEFGEQDAIHDALSKADVYLQYRTSGRGPLLTGRGVLMAALLHALEAMYRETADEAYLHQALDKATWLQSLSANDESRPDVLVAFSNILSLRFGIYHRSKDIEDARSYLAEAFDLDPTNLQAAISLGNLAQLRYQRKKNSSYGELSDAIEHLRKALHCRGMSPVYFAAWSRLAQLLVEISNDGRNGNQQHDLDEAVDILRKTKDVVPINHLQREFILSSLAGALFKRFERDRKSNIDDLDNAIEMSKMAIALPPTHVHTRSAALADLARMFHRRFEERDNEKDREQAIEYYMRCWKNYDADELTRMNAGYEAARQLCELGRWRKAANILAKCAEAMSRVASLASGYEDQQFVLEQCMGIAITCAAVMMNAASEKTENNRESEEGKAPVGLHAALKHLELGRSVLSELSLRNAEVDTLWHRDRDLAEWYQDAWKEWTTFATTPPNPKDASAISPLSLSKHYRHKDIDSRFKNICDKIRAKKGFSRFLMPPSVEEWREAAGDGTVVVVNHHYIRSDAFLISKNNIRSIPLPDLTEEGITSRTKTRYTLETLEWLWTTIASPILQALGFIERPKPPSKKWPRIWWIPTGLLANFPLHAAGIHRPKSTDTVLDRVMSSYIDSVKTLVHYHRAAAAAAAADPNEVLPKPDEQQQANNTYRALLVAMPTTPQDPSGGPYIRNLPAARDEIQLVKGEMERRRGGQSFFEPTVLEHNTREECLSKLAGCSIFHFAGHGQVDKAVPSNSRLLLDDWQEAPLTMESLSRLRQRPPRDDYDYDWQEEAPLSRLRQRRNDYYWQEEEEAPLRRLGQRRDDDDDDDDEGGGGGGGGGAGPKQKLLAYLSACSTAAVRNERLLGNESIHLAGGMLQLAGFRHVVCTLWPVSDSRCVGVAKTFYKSLLPTEDEGGAVGIGNDDVCMALHKAVRRLRWRDYQDYRQAHSSWGRLRLSSSASERSIRGGGGAIAAPQVTTYPVISLDDWREEEEESDYREIDDDGGMRRTDSCEPGDETSGWLFTDRINPVYWAPYIHFGV